MSVWPRWTGPETAGRRTFCGRCPWKDPMSHEPDLGSPRWSVPSGWSGGDEFGSRQLPPAPSTGLLGPGASVGVGPPFSASVLGSWGSAPRRSWLAALKPHWPAASSSRLLDSEVGGLDERWLSQLEPAGAPPWAMIVSAIVNTYGFGGLPRYASRFPASVDALLAS